MGRPLNFHSLSQREKEIVYCFSKGASYILTAQWLNISPSTVHSHAKRIFKKLNIHSRYDLLNAERLDNHQLPCIDLEQCYQNGPQLTPREKEVGLYLAKGLTRKQTAELLGISPETVKSYTDAIYDKIGVRSRYELISKFAAFASDFNNPQNEGGAPWEGVRGAKIESKCPNSVH